MKEFKLGLLLIIFIFSAVDCQRWNANGRPLGERKVPRAGSYYSEETNGDKSTEINSALRSQVVKPSPRGGIGAWGYVSIILFVILSGLGVYYTILFYPIVCKKQRTSLMVSRRKENPGISIITRLALPSLADEVRRADDLKKLVKIPLKNSCVIL